MNQFDLLLKFKFSLRNSLLKIAITNSFNIYTGRNITLVTIEVQFRSAISLSGWFMSVRTTCTYQKSIVLCKYKNLPISRISRSIAEPQRISLCKIFLLWSTLILLFLKKISIFGIYFLFNTPNLFGLIKISGDAKKLWKIATSDPPGCYRPAYSLESCSC